MKMTRLIWPAAIAAAFAFALSAAPLHGTAVQQPSAAVTVDADDRTFTMRARIDTPFEREVFRAGGILAYTLRALLG